MDVIKFIKAQNDSEMAKLKDAKDDDMYARFAAQSTEVSI